MITLFCTGHGWPPKRIIVLYFSFWGKPDFHLSTFSARTLQKGDANWLVVESMLNNYYS